MDALPIEVREALERMPSICDPHMAAVWAHGMASCGVEVCKDMSKGRQDSARETAVRLAAAGIRLVEYLNQDWP